RALQTRSPRSCVDLEVLPQLANGLVLFIADAFAGKVQLTGNVRDRPACARHVQDPGLAAIEDLEHGPVKGFAVETIAAGAGVGNIGGQQVPALAFALGALLDGIDGADE